MSRCNKFESIFKYTKTSKAKVIYSTLRLFRNVTISTTFGSKFVADIQASLISAETIKSIDRNRAALVNLTSAFLVAV